MAAEKFIIAGGFATRIKYYGFDRPHTAGNPVLILLHGYLESLDVWEDFIPLLRDFRVVAIDIPGHGISQVKGDIHTMGMMADVAAGVAGSLQVEKFYLCGHSMGGYVAAEFLARHPERLEAIIMLHSTPNPDTEEKKERRQREIELVKNGKKDLLAMSVEKTFAEVNRSKFTDFIADLKELMILTEEDGVINLLRGMMQREDRNGTFRDSPVPQLFIMGEMDEHIPLETARELENTHPQAKFEYLSGSGHIGFVEEPEKTAGIITGFIQNK